MIPDITAAHVPNVIDEFVDVNPVATINDPHVSELVPHDIVPFTVKLVADTVPAVNVAVDVNDAHVTNPVNPDVPDTDNC